MFVIDRFENGWAVIEYDRKTFNLPRQLVPPDAVEGDVVDITVKVNVKATADLKKDVRGMADELFKD